MMIQLSMRLSAVADMVTITGILADVGTDHGYIPVFLAGEKRIQRAIAMDVNQGPLKRAQEHIRQYGLEDRISTRLSDGLEALRPGEADSIVIAGMGGALMKRILAQGEEAARTAKELILQPQSEIMEFRRFLWESNYEITEENMVFEDGKYYPMMRVEKGSESPYSEVELLYGRNLLQRRHPVLKSYLEFVVKEKEKVLESLKASTTERAKERALEVEEELRTAKEGLSCYVERS